MTQARALERISLSWNMLTKLGIALLLATPVLAICLYFLGVIPERLMWLTPFAVILPIIGLMDTSLFLRLLRMANGDLAPAPFLEELEHAASRALYDIELELARRGHRLSRLELHLRYIEPTPGMRPDCRFLLRLSPIVGSNTVITDYPDQNHIRASEVEALLCPSLHIGWLRRRALFRRFENDPLTVKIDLRRLSNHARLKRIAAAREAPAPIRNFCDKIVAKMT